MQIVAREIVFRYKEKILHTEIAETVRDITQRIFRVHIRDVQTQLR